MSEYALEKVVEFLGYAGEKGLIKASTAQGYRVALSKLEDSFSDQERADIRAVDTESVFQRFLNRNGAKLTPGTLREYRRRLRTSIDEFLKWKADPTAYKPKGRSSSPKRESDVGQSGGEEGKSTGSIAGDRPHPPVGSGILDIPFPLRPDFVATIQIPRDMKRIEAERLAAFVRTLAIDFKPE